MHGGADHQAAQLAGTTRRLQGNQLLLRPADEHNFDTWTKDQAV